MNDNPYQPPRENAVGRPRLTARSKFHVALFMVQGAMTGLALFAILILGLGWPYNAALSAFIALGFAMGFFIGPLQRRDD